MHRADNRERRRLMSDEPQRLEGLIAATLDGVATDDQRAALASRLSTDADARRLYRRYVNLHVTLKTYGALPAIMPHQPPPPRQRAGSVPLDRQRWRQFAAV